VGIGNAGNKRAAEFLAGPVNRQPQNGNRLRPKQYPKKTSKKNMTGGKLSPRVFAVVNNEKEVILCLVINGLCREALFLFGGLRSSLLVARKTEPSRSKPTIKGFFDTRSRKRGMIASLFFYHISLSMPA
jgi:hypothetical protein